MSALMKMEAPKCCTKPRGKDCQGAVQALKRALFSFFILLSSYTSIFINVFHIDINECLNENGEVSADLCKH